MTDLIDVVPEPEHLDAEEKLLWKDGDDGFTRSLLRRISIARAALASNAEFVLRAEAVERELSVIKREISVALGYNNTAPLDLMVLRIHKLAKSQDAHVSDIDDIASEAIASGGSHDAIVAALRIGRERGEAARAGAARLAEALRDAIYRLVTLNQDVFRQPNFTDRYEDGDANEEVIRRCRAVLAECEPGPCKVNEISSRMCARGTKGCEAIHDQCRHGGGA
jgi:hypothetical protein